MVKWSLMIGVRNPAEVYSFYSVNCTKRTKINKKRPGWPIRTTRHQGFSQALTMSDFQVDFR